MGLGFAGPSSSFLPAHRLTAAEDLARRVLRRLRRLELTGVAGARVCCQPGT